VIARDKLRHLGPLTDLAAIRDWRREQRKGAREHGPEN
jgi:hypothetical protein